MSNVTALKPRTQPAEIWLSPEGVCDVWPGMTIRRLQRMRDEGRGPAYSKAGRTITYAASDITSYINAHRITTREQS